MEPGRTILLATKCICFLCGKSRVLICVALYGWGAATGVQICCESKFTTLRTTQLRQRLHNLLSVCSILSQNPAQALACCTPILHCFHHSSNKKPRCLSLNSIISISNKMKFVPFQLSLTNITDLELFNSQRRCINTKLQVSTSTVYRNVRFVFASPLNVMVR